MTQQRSNESGDPYAYTDPDDEMTFRLEHPALLARVLELEQENERMATSRLTLERERNHAVVRAERAEALIARQLGDCIGCTTEPEETCPRDGRTYTEWVNIASEVIGRENAARDVLEQAAHWHVYESHDIGEAFPVDTVRDWIDEIAAALSGLSLQEERGDG